MTVLASQSPPPAAVTEFVRPAGFWAGAWRRFRRNKLALFGLFFVVVVFLAALLAPVISPYPYDAIDPQSALHLPGSIGWGWICWDAICSAHLWSQTDAAGGR